jgi:hypothetical protein
MPPYRVAHTLHRAIYKRSIQICFVRYGGDRVLVTIIAITGKGKYVRKTKKQRIRICTLSQGVYCSEQVAARALKRCARVWACPIRQRSSDQLSESSAEKEARTYGYSFVDLAATEFEGNEHTSAFFITVPAVSATCMRACKCSHLASSPWLDVEPHYPSAH